MTKPPMFMGWKPSTSFSMLTVPTTLSEDMCYMPIQTSQRSATRSFLTTRHAST
jgi:hypothetical protein